MAGGRLCRSGQLTGQKRARRFPEGRGDRDPRTASVGWQGQKARLQDIERLKMKSSIARSWV